MIAELLLLSRLPLIARIIVALATAAACVAAGVAALGIQHHFAAQPNGGRLAALLAGGSSAATAWTGWAAAIFFAAAVWRLRAGAPEPPAGRTPIEQLTLAQLRAGLVREYTVVRVGLVLLCGAAIVDAARAARYVVAVVAGDALARTTLAATLVEATGLMTAAVVLALWAGSFRAQLDRVGALRNETAHTV
jgi:hypothetical protein